MLIDASQLMGYVLLAEDGELGRCKDFLVDDRGWNVRYLVGDTRKWLPGRRVLLPPAKVKEPDFAARRLPLQLTKEQVIASPPLEEHEPLSRRYEIMWFDYYGISHYWLEEENLGMTENPTAIPVAKRESAAANEEEEETHVFSVSEMKGRSIAATDGDIGHLADVMVDLETWKLRYAVVDTRNWLPGKQVCISMTCVEWVDQVKDRVGVSLSKEKIKHSPEYNPFVPITEEYQMVLHDYYGWPKYWESR
jgi:sporulation protein YlmC with PRC-barrel domain